MFVLKAVLASSVLASSAVAHFTLDYPPTRGFDDDKEPQFCGGFNTVSSVRNPFPLNGAPVWIDSHHTLASVATFVSNKTSPSNFSDFTNVTNYFQVKNGEYCWGIDFEGLGFTNGSEVTVQIQYNGGDGNLFQCTDLVLLSDYTIPTNRTCATDASVTAVNISATVPVPSAAPASTSAPGASGSHSGSAGASAAPTSSSKPSGELIAKPINLAAAAVGVLALGWVAL
ncbi:putative protein [Vanrija pseudolonga]|uniref:Purtative protein n=1 Tax=Vanrija pseudolonga TaxID=143232 RepID=A0AAF0YDH0_9TREE|nr:purtative protein [Vanrija pseudolonga]